MTVWPFLNWYSEATAAAAGYVADGTDGAIMLDGQANLSP